MSGIIVAENKILSKELMVLEDFLKVMEDMET